LLTSEGEEWKRQRRHRRRFASSSNLAYADTMVGYSRRLIESWLSPAKARDDAS
jgi:hypothetical protein